ncbi:tRNA1(Val) (adenine(37)-N6)-methyltransferase [Haematobacter genomosp. 1]|uniref:Methyltransferase n=1 Tax=Haematobacter genomosp. 1 TaxID=366618 RepID=A0A212ABP1_9RHOB|nr:methyltransferase [Haematobacter genomosp. 1]OWJ78162.1 methyltransferase [Haematobacter genomosp. 1]
MTQPVNGVPPPRFADGDLTSDGFLGGRLRILQPRDGYRAAVDPVLLAASVPAREGESVLELGCGAGVASLCLGRRVPGLRLAGVERQAAYADLARRNATANGIPMVVTEGDIAALPPPLKAESFNHVIANPPYYRAQGGTRASDPGREAALREETPLDLWVETGLKRLAPGGYLSIIQAADRLPELLAALSARTGGIVVLPLAPREGRAARRIICRARKGSRAAFRLLAPFVLHEGVSHERDGENFKNGVSEILRDGKNLPFQ